MVVRGVHRGWWAPVLALVVLVGIVATSRVEVTDQSGAASRPVASSTADIPRAVAVLPNVLERAALVDFGILGAGFIAVSFAAAWLTPADEQLDRRSTRFLGAAWCRRGPPFRLSD